MSVQRECVGKVGAGGKQSQVGWRRMQLPEVTSAPTAFRDQVCILASPTTRGIISPAG